MVKRFFFICDGILTYGERVVIPGTLQKRKLKDFHTGHTGIARMKSLIRSYVFWSYMDKGIEENVKFCRGCTIAAEAQPVKFTPWPKTERPCSRLHIEFNEGTILFNSG